MDFLDPRKRRAHRTRLIIGYCLMWIAIILGTIILVYAADGYGINTKTGEIVENGLVFADSHPGGASIYLNGQYQNSTTAARLVLPTGNYTLALKKTGYRGWQRTFTLDARTIARYVYPFLFPIKPVTTTLKNYTNQPPLLTQSPDRRWLLVQNPDASGKSVSFDEFDSTNLKKAIQTVDMPSGLLTNESPSASLSVVEWSTDNNHVLLKHAYDGGDEYVVFDRANPSDSFNVNKMFNLNPSQVALFNKKVSQLYIYDQTDGSLRLGDTGKSTVADPILKNVLAFKPYGTDLIEYITDKNQPAGKVQARIWNNGQTYPLYTFKAGNKYVLDFAQYQGQWYYFAGSDADSQINIFKNPINDIKDPSIGRATPMLALQISGATKAGFSANTQFIAIEAGQKFAVYDILNSNTYLYTLNPSLAQDASWMDGDRLLGESGNNVFVMDYDGTNQQTLGPTLEPDGGLFSQDYNHLLDVQAASSGGFNLVNTDMRAGSDLPKNP